MSVVLYLSPNLRLTVAFRDGAYTKEACKNTLYDIIQCIYRFLFIVAEKQTMNYTRGYESNISYESTHTEFDQLKITFVLQRIFMFYLFDVYLPTMLLMVCFDRLLPISFQFSVGLSKSGQVFFIGDL